MRRADALLLGVLSLAGAVGGVVLANALSGDVLRDGFAALMVLVAAQLVHRALRERRGPMPRDPSRGSERDEARPRRAGRDPAARSPRAVPSMDRENGLDSGEHMGLDNPLHIAFLVVILLLVFGAKRLPEIGRSLGSGMREFKQWSHRRDARRQKTAAAAGAHGRPSRQALPAAAPQQAAAVAAQPAPVAAQPAARRAGAGRAPAASPSRPSRQRARP